MLFHTYEYLVLFLPLSLFAYFALNRRRGVAWGGLWLLSSSLFFYAFWRVEYLPLLLFSIAVNYGSSRLLSRPGDRVGRFSKRS